MAAEAATMPVNGNYAPHQGQSYGTAEQNQVAYTANKSTSTTGEQRTASTPNTATNTSGGNSDIPKSEVGWYFVEQYYTTLSRSPEKLHLFYNKRSQFVSGEEAAKLPVCIGRDAIHNRIKELDFQDCKIRVSNVDSQASDKNIVIQVIGGISIKSEPHRKFVQTFVLAEQTNGYFVLNDIFRYLADEKEEEMEPAVEETQQDVVAQPGDAQEPAPAAEDVAGDEPLRTLPSSEDPVAQEQAAQQLDREIEEKVLHEEPQAQESSEPEVTSNGALGEEVTNAVFAEEAPVAAVDTVGEEDTAPAVDAVSTEEILEPEKPKDPEPSPVASPPKSAPPQPAPPVAVPPARKTWANLVAGNQANRVATPAAVATVPTPSPAPTQPKPAVAAQTQAPPAAAPAAGPSTAAPPTAPTAAREPSPTPSSSQQPAGSEWQSVGHEHGRRQNRPQATAGPPQNDGSRAYIKNVSESVTIDQLRDTMQKFGEVTYCDINRQKNCGFVDFISPAAFQAALGANPHQIDSDTLYVEERRLGPAPGRFNGPFVPRGGANRGRGDGNPRGGRGGFQKDGNRGGYGPRGRGANAAPRGRGAPQAA